MRTEKPPGFCNDCYQLALQSKHGLTKPWPSATRTTSPCLASIRTQRATWGKLCYFHLRITWQTCSSSPHGRARRSAADQHCCHPTAPPAAWRPLPVSLRGTIASALTMLPDTAPGPAGRPPQPPVTPRRGGPAASPPRPAPLRSAALRAPSAQGGAATSPPPPAASAASPGAAPAPAPAAAPCLPEARPAAGSGSGSAPAPLRSATPAGPRPAGPLLAPPRPPSRALTGGQRGGGQQPARCHFPPATSPRPHCPPPARRPAPRRLTAPSPRRHRLAPLPLAHTSRGPVRFSLGDWSGGLSVKARPPYTERRRAVPPPEPALGGPSR